MSFVIRPLRSLPSIRSYASAATQVKAARYEQNGRPEDVLVYSIRSPFALLLLKLSVVDNTLPPLGKDDIQVKMLFSPINPADLNIVSGNYAAKIPGPATGGSEGLARVIAVGSNVKSLNAGDLVLPNKQGLGNVCGVCPLLLLQALGVLLQSGTLMT